MNATDEKNTQKIRKVTFDSSALNGLRGFAAIHILLYHSLLFSTWGFHNYGNVSMLKILWIRIKALTVFAPGEGVASIQKMFWHANFLHLAVL